jgi:cell division protein FtsX
MSGANVAVAPLRLAAAGGLLAALAAGLAAILVVALGLADAAQQELTRTAARPAVATLAVPAASLGGARRDALERLLRERAEIAWMDPVSPAQVAQLMQRWLGEPPGAGAELPVLFDLMLQPGTHELDALEAAIVDLVPEAGLVAEPAAATTHMTALRWQRDLGAAAALAALLLVLPCAALIGRHAAQQQRDELELMRLLGAADRSLLTAIERDALRAGLAGAACGALAGFGLLVAIVTAARQGWLPATLGGAPGLAVLLLAAAGALSLALLAALTLRHALRGPLSGILSLIHI